MPKPSHALSTPSTKPTDTLDFFKPTGLTGWGSEPVWQANATPVTGCGWRPGLRRRRRISGWTICLHPSGRVIINGKDPFGINALVSTPMCPEFLISAQLLENYSWLLINLVKYIVPQGVHHPPFEHDTPEPFCFSSISRRPPIRRIISDYPCVLDIYIYIVSVPITLRHQVLTIWLGLGDAWSLGVSPPVPLPHSGCSVKTKRSFNQLAYALNSAAHVALDLCSLPLKTYSPSPRMTSLGSDTACNKRPVAVAQHAHVTLPAFVVFLQAWDWGRWPDGEGGKSFSRSGWKAVVFDG